MKRLIRLGVALAALTLAGPAAADGPGQSAVASLGTGQEGSANVASVNVLSHGGGKASSRENGSGANAAAPGNDGNSQSGNQNASRSIGTVQVGSVGIAPATAINAPVAAKTPAKVLLDGTGGSSSPSEGIGPGASAAAPGHGGSDTEADVGGKVALPSTPGGVPLSAPT